VLVVDDDAVIVGLIDEVLTDEGYAVVAVQDQRSESVRTAVADLRPDCVLLDGDGSGDFGESWRDAAWIAALPDRVPVVMFSADRQAIGEAQRRESERSQDAHFSSVLSKPFDLDELLRVVALAVARRGHADRSVQACCSAL
jgi:CheY-like chemotaxis protein